MPQWLSVNTQPLLKDGNRGKLYDWLNEETDRELIDAAIKPLDKERFNNILAIAAPENGKGLYTEAQLIFTLQSLLCGFEGAVIKARESGRRECALHTGRWGCGAFGNNEELMLLSQIIAASLAGITRLVFYAVSKEAVSAVKNKFEVLPEVLSFDQLVSFLLSQNYLWGQRDGN